MGAPWGLDRRGHEQSRAKLEKKVLLTKYSTAYRADGLVSSVESIRALFVVGWVLKPWRRSK